MQYTNIKNSSFLLLVLCVVSLNLHAAKRYWISSATANWNSTANWSATSGGSSGASVPGNNDTCYFNSSGLGRCDINTNVSVKRFEIVSGYTDTITQNAYTIIVGTGGMSLNGGVFIGSSSTIIISNSYSNSACNFTSTSGTFEIKEGHFSLTGTGAFLHNNGLVKFFHGTTPALDTCRITLSTSSPSKEFYDVECNSNTGYTRYYRFSNGGMKINNDMFLTGAGNKYFGTGTIELLGDYNYTSGTVSGGAYAAGTIKFKGSGPQYLNGAGSGNVSQIVKIDVDKPSDTLHFTGNVCTEDGLSLTNGSLHAGTSRFYLQALSPGATISGSLTGSNSLNKLYFIGTTSSSILTLNDTLQVNDSIVVSASSVRVINKGSGAGIINAKGDVIITTNVAFYGSFTLLMDGNGTQILKSARIHNSNSVITGTPCMIINKAPSDTLKLIGTIIPYNSWTHNSGIIESSQAHVIYAGSAFSTITGSHTLYNAEFQMYGVMGIAISSGTELTILDSLVFSTATSAGSTLINAGVINLKGNLYINSTSPGNGGTATLKINGTSDQHIYGYTASAIYGRLCNTEINKSSGTLYLHNNIAIGASGSGLTFIHNAGIINYGTSTIVVGNNCTFTSNVSGNRLELYNLKVTAPGTTTIGSSTTLVVNNELITDGATGTLLFNGGTLELKGNITCNSTSTSISSAGTTSVLINGSSNQTFTGSGISGTSLIPNITINKSSGALYLASIISTSGNWTYTAGTVDASTYLGKVCFYGNYNLDAQGSSATMSLYDAVVASGTRTLTGDLKVSNNLTINSSTTLAQGSYGLSFGGYANNGTHTYSGAVTLEGSGYNTFSKSGGGSTTFSNLTVNRSGGSLTLGSPVNVTGSLSFTKGVIKTTATNLLGFADNATMSGGSDSGYVHGPVKKTGDDGFVFPLGDTSLIQPYHPLTITAPSNATDVFTSEFKYGTQTYGTKTVDTLESVSNESYYLLTRNTGSSNIKASLSWRDPLTNYVLAEDCVIVSYVDPADSVWHDLGSGARIVSGSLSSVTSTIDVPFSGTTARLLALGKKLLAQTYVKPERHLDGGYYQAINNKLFLKFDNDYNENDRGLKFNIYDKTNVAIVSNSGSSSGPYPLKYKDNRYVLNLASLSSSITNGYFILEVFDKKGEKYYLRFKN